ncbi:GNAT family N-acetyltransferase [Ruminococcaceae bacterium OttesenSCG-928-L11]|nr:GNAT family N-acetyltransferase [Ruminococcaceae bacterium OttesenSCG-928-L11]
MIERASLPPLHQTGTVPLETERLVLRRIRVEDAPAMYQGWATDPEVTRHMPWDLHESVEATAELLTGWVKEYEKDEYYHWVLEYKETGDIIGTLGVHNMDGKNRQCEVGYCIARDYWRRGIVPEALHAVLDHLFGVVGMVRVYAKHSEENPASGRVMEKCGMKPEGILRAAMQNRKGQFVNLALRSILRPEWDMLKRE